MKTVELSGGILTLLLVAQYNYGWGNKKTSTVKFCNAYDNLYFNFHTNKRWATFCSSGENTVGAIGCEWGVNYMSTKNLRVNLLNFRNFKNCLSLFSSSSETIFISIYKIKALVTKLPIGTHIIKLWELEKLHQPSFFFQVEENQGLISSEWYKN